jgi:hypothetical protein
MEWEKKMGECDVHSAFFCDLNVKVSLPSKWFLDEITITNIN